MPIRRQCVRPPRSVIRSGDRLGGRRRLPGDRPAAILIGIDQQPKHFETRTAPALHSGPWPSGSRASGRSGTSTQPRAPVSTTAPRASRLRVRSANGDADHSACGPLASGDHQGPKSTPDSRCDRVRNWDGSVCRDSMDGSNERRRRPWRSGSMRQCRPKPCHG
jgi:hypothetical protein